MFNNVKKITEPITGEPFLCAIWMGKNSLNFYSKEKSFIPFFEQGHNTFVPWISGWRVTKFPTASSDTIVYSVGKDVSIDYKGESKLLIARGPKEEFNAQAIAYLAFWMLEAQRQEGSILTSHAASLSYGGKGVLVLGERGYGKTSTILHLCRKYSYYLIANDLAMIGYDDSSKKATLYDGTKIFGFRLAAIRENFPDLLPKFENTEKDSRTTRVFVYPYEIGIGVENRPIVLQKVFLVYLDATKKDRLSVKVWDDLWIRNYLYENFSRYIRGTAIVAFGAQSKDFLGYLPSLDTPEFHIKRVKLINYLIKDIQILSVSGGNLNEIVEFIYSAVLKES